jgi:hypothetical protein
MLYGVRNRPEDGAPSSENEAALREGESAELAGNQKRCPGESDELGMRFLEDVCQFGRPRRAGDFVLV